MKKPPCEGGGVLHRNYLRRCGNYTTNRKEMRMNKTVYIYTLSCPKTGAVRYVGATVNPPRRFSVHKSNAKTRDSAPVYRWIKSLLDEGLEPIMDIVDTCHADARDEKERYWIQRCKDAGCDLTNQTDGGVHCEYEEETLKKKSKIMSGNGNPIYGRYGNDNPKIKRIIQYDKNGAFIRYWDGIIIASRELKVNQSHICKCCKRKQKYESAGGYIWRYATDPIPQTEQPRLFQDEDK